MRRLLTATCLLLLVHAAPLGGAATPPPPRLPGLSAPAEVVTDRWGIPHVSAATEADLYRAWGWTDARDRLWQMVWTRAAAEGLTHRWTGNAALQADGGAQLFRLRERAAAIWRRERDDTHVRRALEAYAQGVNDRLAQCRRGEAPWPPELQRLRSRPRDWTPADCVLVLLGFGVTLDLDLAELQDLRSVREHGAEWLAKRRRFEGGWPYETVPESATVRLWPERCEDPLPGGARGATTPARDPAPPSRDAVRAAERWLAAWPPHERDGSTRASNQFAVGAARSASGRPLLANDPHLGLSVPSPFHVVHVRAPGVCDAIGAAVPGLPIIVSGRNARAAWGVTAVSADVVDVYADTLSADRRRVKVRDAAGRVSWAPVRCAPFDLRYRVLGVSLPVPSFLNERRFTPHGPVLVWDKESGIAYAARWSALEDDRITLGGLVGLERSASAAEIESRAATLVTPCLNMLAADVDGGVRYRACGLFPVRDEVPLPGPVPSDGRHEWTGFVPTDGQPHWAAPARGFVVNANNRPAGGAYSHELVGYDWAQDRARRIAQRLAGDPHVTLADLASVQNDVVSLAAQRQVRALLAAAGESADWPARERAALDTLRAWDGSARRHLVAPTIARSWWAALQRSAGTEGLPGLTLAALHGQADSVLGATPAAAVRAALTLALDTLESRLGPRPDRWTWGRAHRARFRHPLAALDGRGRWEPPLTPVDGDGATPCVGASRAPWNLEVGAGPAYRHVVDLADPSTSWGVVPPWNSAAFADGERDLRRRWADHDYVPFLLDPVAIARAAHERVALRP